MNFSTLVSATLGIDEKRTQAAIGLFDEGATVPFIARYRKDQTGGLDETQLRDVQHRYEYFKELTERKATIVKSIQEQSKMTPELQKQIDTCVDKVKLEDLYLPFKPKRRTRATMAREKGLEPLADIIRIQEASTNTAEDIARIYCSEENGVTTPDAAITGALDILAEEISENAEYRQYLRELGESEGLMVSKVRKEFEGKKTKFETYYDFKEKVVNIPSHRVLAIRRGEKDKVLRLSIEVEDARMTSYLESKVIQQESIWSAALKTCCTDAWERLMKPSMETEVRLASKTNAEDEAFNVFGKNLRDVLLAAPAGQKSVLALDPGFRSGVKVAVMDANGKFVNHAVIYPHPPQNQTSESAKVLRNMLTEYNVEMIAIGNGTASRETDAFASKIIANMDKKPIKVVVSEAGASVYSASPEAIKEFPNEDVTTRGAISIGRRLQDPLAELVKVEAKSIGVGQYQHDVNQSKLKKSLDEVVESCVNNVGVNLNQASAPLLSYVAGISKPIAANIVKYREENGAFTTRKELLKVPKFGPKAFEQSAGFLRIIAAENKLDASAVHPENYDLVEQIATDLQLEMAALVGNASALKSLDSSKYISEKVGQHTLEDILQELEKPNRDPRSEFKYATFNDKIQSINDLVTGSWLEGVVTNVTNFGAFVDVGVHQDGLVHISEIGNKFVQDAKEVIKVGDIVKCRVVAVDTAQKRIALSLKEDQGQEGGSARKGGRRKKAGSHIQKTATIADLKNAFKNGSAKGNGQKGKKPGTPQKPAISLKSIMRSGR